MKPKSYFVAVSRGGIDDMGGLVKALDSKRLAVLEWMSPIPSLCRRATRCGSSDRRPVGRDAVDKQNAY